MHITFKTSPFKAVDYNEKAIKKALDNAGYLIAECKYDGVRGNIVVDNTANAMWLSRVTKSIPSLAYMDGFDVRWQRLLKDDRCIFPEGFMLDGELMVKGVDFNTGSGLLRTKWVNNKNLPFIPDSNLVDAVDTFGKIRKNHPFALDTKHLKVVLYAILPYHIMESGEDYDTPSFLMREHVKAILPLLKEYFPEIEWVLSEAFEVYDMVELTKLYELKRSEGHEGLVVKDPMGIYKRGKKSGWYKMKPSEEADGIIQGLVWGTPGLANEGKVIGFEVLLESGAVVNACNISRELMDEFTEHVQDIGEYAYDGWACQISYMEKTPSGSLRHPTFVMFRGTEEDRCTKM